MIPLRDNIPSRSFPVVNVALIVVNVIVFFYEVSLGPSLDRFIFTYGLVPRKFFAEPSLSLERWIPLFSSIFLHGGWMHLAGNMLYLWIFGDNVEDRMGPARYLVFYLLCGLAAATAQMTLNSSSVVPMVGASGAIAGVMGAYFLLYPHARVITLIPIFFFIELIEIPAFFFLGFWIVFQFFSGTASLALSMEHGVAWWAHIGGFVAGMFLVRPFVKRRPPTGRRTIRIGRYIS
ncbi:MAG: rhomboid family intramembrane serine protease [Deltaproteobacteria bacterium]|nr:MAG: rhomboid family intramembrane serine protease [Deltaproteobacteria bacterium]